MINRSLRVRVATFLLIPMAAVAGALGVGGSWFVDTFVTNTFDRTLGGSVLSIAERLTILDGQITVSIPAAAFGMLSNSERDSIFYSVTAENLFITGYEDLPQPKQLPHPNTLVYRDTVYRGQPVRIGMMLKPIYVTQHMALVQVAETTNGRNRLASRMLTALTALGVALASIGSLLVWLAVRIGLNPLDKLRTEIEIRRGAAHKPIAPFPLAGVPSEALPLVSAWNDLLAQLNRSMQVLRQFTADASHQLRTPVAILKTHLDLLDRHQPGGSSWRSSRADIDTAVKRLDRLISQLLALASIEDESSSRTLTAEFNLRDIARDVALDFAVIARRQNIELSFDAPESPIIVAAEPFLLDQALRNLLDNAVRYNRSGGHVHVGVQIEAAATGSKTAKLYVEDDGPGIPEGQRELAFERFHRIERAGDPSGSGLGLAIVRAFIARANGTVSLLSRPGGQGLRVEITLAIASPDRTRSGSDTIAPAVNV